MLMSLLRTNVIFAGLLAASFGFVGCSQNSAPPQATAQSGHAGHDHGDADHHDGDGHDHGSDKDAHDHSGWWCAEHGVPESECSQCDSKVAAAFQKKGDWCKEHDRANSQCFICNPKAKDKYVAMYKAKYGKEPPAMEEEVDTQSAKAKG